MDSPLLALMGENDLKIVDPFPSLTPIAKIGVGLGIESFSEDGRFFSLVNRERGTVSFFSIQSSVGRTPRCFKLRHRDRGDDFPHCFKGGLTHPKQWRSS